MMTSCEYVTNEWSSSPLTFPFAGESSRAVFWVLLYHNPRLHCRGLTHR